MTQPFRVAVEMAPEAGERLLKIFEKIGKAADDAAKAGGKTADDAAKAAGNGGSKGQSAAQKSLKDRLKAHPVRNTAIAAGALGAGALAYNVLKGDGPADGSLTDVAQTIANTLPTADAVAAGGFSFENDGEIELDPDRMAAFTAGLRDRAPRFAAAGRGIAEACEDLKAVFARDGGGEPTRDGAPSPGISDLYSSIDALAARATSLTRLLADQLTSDAAWHDKYAEKFMAVQEENAKRVDSIDAGVSL